MKHLDLLGIQLKDDFLNDLFETYEVEVIYEYDRTHENLPDEYRAKIPDLGLQFVFDENQALFTLFIEQKEKKTWNPFKEDDARLKIFSSKVSARNYAKENGIATTEGNTDFMGEEKNWIRFDLSGHSIHYEFVGGSLKKITLQNKK